MASHGKKRHTKTLAAPRALNIPRKQKHWVKTTKPGPHGKENAIPLVVLLRDLLKICTNAREVKRILQAEQVQIDGKPTDDAGRPIGLMDVVTIKGGDSFTIVNKKGKLTPIKTKVISEKLCKITGKHLTKNGKIQLSLHDGRTVIVPDGKIYSTGDTVKISIPKAKITHHLKLEKGSKCLVFKGRHAGAIGSLIDIQVFPGITPSNARITSEDGKEVVTLKDYVFVVDKDFKV